MLAQAVPLKDMNAVLDVAQTLQRTSVTPKQSDFYG
jgi:hypothetical protein